MRVADATQGCVGVRLVKARPPVAAEIRVAHEQSALLVQPVQAISGSALCSVFVLERPSGFCVLLAVPVILRLHNLTLTVDTTSSYRTLQFEWKAITVVDQLRIVLKDGTPVTRFADANVIRSC